MIKINKEMTPLNVTYIISNLNKAIAFEWISEKINSDKFELSFILINCNGSYLGEFLTAKGFKVYYLESLGKKQLPSTILKCRKILKELHTDIVHCHLITANLIGLTAAKLAGIKMRIYTRHHSDYHFVYFPKAVKWDKYCNRMATKIVSISENVSKILIEKEQVNPSKVVKIWHGFDVESFIQPDESRCEALKQKYNPDGKYPVIGVISRFIHLKGIQFILPAYQRFLERYPDALLLLFNAKGDYEETLNQQLEALPIESYQKVSFENDITNLYSIFDFFIHVPISPSVEAFGQTYVETMLAGVPLIATKSGVGDEILQNETNALVVGYENSEDIYQAMIRLMEEKDLRERIIENARKSVEGEFSVERMIEKLEELYSA